ncbi:MAG: flavodoxin, partial [Bacilli bacterium]
VEYHMLELKDKKILIAYFSRAGENYVNNAVEKLKVGNTKVAAYKIQSLVKGDLFKIVPKKSYSDEYRKCVLEAKDEYNENTRPDIKGKVNDFDSYDIVFLGYPNWMGTCPMPVFTFLESYDFKDKIILPFCTNEGSGAGNSLEDIKKSAPTATVLNSLSLRGSQIDDSDDKIKEWLKKIAD